jgi:ribonucleotide monophosphatase NagD (HAD superfamily)
MKNSLLSLSMLAAMTVSASASAFAASDEQIAAKCFETGKTKIAEQAKAYGCEVDVKQTTVQEIDNRWYNPSKYVWYEVKGQCNGYDTIIKMVQYYKGQCL